MISFCLITDGKEPDKLEAQLTSIHALGVPHYEIIVSGNPPVGIDADCIVPMPATAMQGRLGALRNGAAWRAQGEILVVTDDDMLFHPGWYEGLQACTADWDVMACRIHNPDGSRYWDWKAHSNGKNWLLDYNETNELVSLTGGLTICKRHVWEHVKWNDDLCFNQAEDVDFTNRVKAAGYSIVFNPLMTITHDAPYTQKGVGVYKKE